MEERSLLRASLWHAFKTNDWDKSAILKISSETNSFAKGIRDLYRVIVPIASRKVTISPRISPRQFFPNKIFSQNIFLDWAYSRDLFEGGSIFLTGTKNVTKATLFFYLMLLNMLKTADIL